MVIQFPAAFRHDRIDCRVSFSAGVRLLVVRTWCFLVLLVPSWAFAQQDECLQAGWTSSAGPSSWLLDVGDANGDGHIDALAGYMELRNNGAQSTAWLVVALGDGTGRFSVLEPVAVDARTSSAVFVDLNEDGRDDVVAASYSNSRIVTFLARQTGELSRRRNVRVGPRVYSVSSADFDGDGHADVFATSLDGVRYFRGNGRGGLRRVGHLREGRMPTIPLVGHFDGDEHADLLVLHNDSHTAAIYRGGGRFQLTQSIDPVCGSPSSPVLGDFDADGHLDAVYGCSRAVHMFRGTGSMRFIDAGAVASIRTPWMSAVDIDRDGRLELVATDDNGRHLVVLEMNNQGLFLERARVSLPAQSLLRPRTADLDEDGWPDILLVINQRGGAVFQAYSGRACGGAWQPPARPPQHMTPPIERPHPRSGIPGR